MPGPFDGIGKAFELLMWLSALTVPLALWKLGEIIIWAIRHVSVSIT